MAAGSPGRSQLSGRQGLKLAVRNGVNVFYISYTEMELLVEKGHAKQMVENQKLFWND